MSEAKGVLVRFSPQALADVDRVRGRVPRTVWVRDLCTAAVIAHDALEGPSVAPVVERAQEATLEAGSMTGLQRAEADRIRLERAPRLSQGHGR